MYIMLLKIIFLNPLVSGKEGVSFYVVSDKNDKMDIL